MSNSLDKMSNSPKMMSTLSAMMSNSPEIMSYSSDMMSNSSEIMSNSSDMMSNSSEIMSNSSVRMSNSPLILFSCPGIFLPVRPGRYAVQPSGWRGPGPCSRPLHTRPGRSRSGRQGHRGRRCQERWGNFTLYIAEKSSPYNRLFFFA